MNTSVYRDYQITITLTTLHALPLLPEMEGWYDTADIEVDNLDEALQIAQESVDANYRLFAWASSQE